MAPLGSKRRTYTHPEPRLLPTETQEEQSTRGVKQDNVEILKKKKAETDPRVRNT